MYILLLINMYPKLYREREGERKRGDRLIGGGWAMQMEMKI